MPNVFVSSLSRFLKFIWPISKNELPVFLSITGLMFCIQFIQNLIRALKDSIINTMIGTEIISFLKFWGVMPFSFLVVIVYVKVIHYVESRKIFYCVLSSFLAFFLFFAFYIFPNHADLHLEDEKINSLIALHPHLKWFILLFAKWGFSLFYIIAESWPNVMLGLLFWQFINQATTVEQSRRFYGLFGLIGQTGLFISGQFLVQLPSIGSYILQTYHLDSSLTIVSVQILLLVVVAIGIIGLGFFTLLNKLLVSKKIQIVFKDKGKKFGLLDSIKMILQSRYIRLIAVLMICYGISINLVEGPWKSRAAKNYTAVEEYASFTGHYLSYTGICTVAFVLINSSIIRSFGWFWAAIVTPAVLLTTGMLFFVTNSFESANLYLSNLFFVSDPLMFIIVVGAIQNVLSKSTKYTFFDITKEMTYVPLPDDLKAKGKAAVDVIATKVGKSLSSLIQSCVFVLFPYATLESISIYLMVIFAFVCIIWIWAVRELADEYSKISLSNK